MPKIRIKYAVIILNFNTINDAINAANSVIVNALADDYIICISDNASSILNDRSTLNTVRLKNTVTYQLSTNTGYANGNNESIKFILNSYTPDYIVIMNPDVLLLEKGTIEGMIDQISIAGDQYVGGQPLVWNCFYGNDAAVQQNIRRIPDYTDLCITRLKPLRYVFIKRYQLFEYKSERPYRNHIDYYVPSGAFFVIKTHIFEEIGLFDPNTFLYFEEYILGYKIREINKKLLFMPEYIVRHEHGKSTGSNRFHFNNFAARHSLESCLYYAETYLGVNKSKKIFLIILHHINNLMMKIATSLANLMNNYR